MRLQKVLNTWWTVADKFWQYKPLSLDRYSGYFDKSYSSSKIPAVNSLYTVEV